ncbi:MAG: hypothetical protein ACHREM_19335, partial [Polyangiales bacterium]
EGTDHRRARAAHAVPGASLCDVGRSRGARSERRAFRRSLPLYDLSVTKMFPDPVALGTVGGHVEALHKRQREIFEDSITDDTRRLFQ